MNKSLTSLGQSLCDLPQGFELPQSSAAPPSPAAVENAAGLAHSKTPSRAIGLALSFVAAALLLASLKFPLWQMRLEAPQYRGEESLQISVHPNALHGDLNELKVLDQYIGVHVPPTLPQFKWLPAVLVTGAILGLLAGLVPVGFRRRALLVVTVGLTAMLALAAIQAKLQMHDIGHDRDQHTPLVGIQDFTPPFLGTTKIAQFEVSSKFGLGAWLIGAALALQLGAAWKAGSRRTRVNDALASTSEMSLLTPAPTQSTI